MYSKAKLESHNVLMQLLAATLHGPHRKKHRYTFLYLAESAIFSFFHDPYEQVQAEPVKRIRERKT